MEPVICQNCGAAWPADLDVIMLRMESDPVLNPYQENSPKSIADAGATLVTCPKCPIPDVDQAMYRGADRWTAGDETRELD